MGGIQYARGDSDKATKSFFSLQFVLGVFRSDQRNLNSLFPRTRWIIIHRAPIFHLFFVSHTFLPTGTIEKCCSVYLGFSRQWRSYGLDSRLEQRVCDSSGVAAAWPWVFRCVYEKHLFPYRDSRFSSVDVVELSSVAAGKIIWYFHCSKLS